MIKGPHQPRTISYLGLRKENGWRMKYYGIARDGGRPGAALVSAAERAVEQLPTYLDDDESYGVGFCIVHEAGARSYVLVDWWAAQNEIHQRLLSAPGDVPDELAPHPSAAIGCVWELAVTDFERRAWLQHVLANPDGPDMDAYLEATFEAKL
ncbi:hypothetical protein ACGFIF_15540 [Kribbella sp. NPDC049174]|uniref:hypothetical protein n=1 Tax=Kribbella sp. NPDC049174 TaxID=3364112 RepID=UPI003721B52F